MLISKQSIKDEHVIQGLNIKGNKIDGILYFKEIIYGFPNNV